MLTIATFKWRGWRGNMYTAKHVLALRNMVGRHLRQPHRFVCITDDKRGLRDVETLPLWPMHEGFDAEVLHHPNCYRRMLLFADEARLLFGDRILHLDLDCIITGALDPLIPEPGTGFKVVKGHVADYNGSMWYVEPGYRPDLWHGLTQDAADRAQAGTGGYGSDQVWMSHMLPSHATWGPEDGVYQYHTDITSGEVPAGARVIFFAGPKKPWKCSMTSLYLRESRPVAPSG